jgi:lysophospholipase L1-like esterase
MHEAVRFVALGDSIVHGHMVPEDRAWPAVLLALLRQHRPQTSWDMVNSGACGETMVQGLERLERDALRHQPDVLFIAFGLNDCHLAHSATDAWRVRQTLPEIAYGPLGKFRAYRAVKRRLDGMRGGTSMPQACQQERVGPAAFLGSMEQMIERAKQAGVPHVFLMTMTPVDDRALNLWPNELRERQRIAYEQYNRVIRATALAMSTSLIDAEADMPIENRSSFLDYDGIHLTPLGQEELAQVVYRTLETDGMLNVLEQRGRLS